MVGGAPITAGTVQGAGLGLWELRQVRGSSRQMSGPMDWPPYPWSGQVIVEQYLRGCGARLWEQPLSLAQGSLWSEY